MTPDLVTEHPRHRFPCQGGPQFGSRYPGHPRRLTLHDFLPDQQLRQVENLHDFAGMLVFDKWTCNTNGRQTLFLADLSSTGGLANLGNKRDDFVAATLREVGIEPVPMEGFAVWVAKLKPLLQ